MKHLLTALGVLCAVLALPMLARADSVATPSTLTATLQAAPCGSTVLLVGSSPFGPSRALTGRQCPATAPLRVVATGATINGLWYFSRLTGLDVNGGLWTAGLRFDDASAIGVHGSAFSGPNTAAGLMLVRVRQVRVEESRFTGFKAGVSVIDADGLRIEGNTFDGLRADGVIIGRGANVLIAGNICQGMRPIQFDHPDCIQFYVNNTALVSTNIRIERNTLSGIAQGVFLADGAYQNVLIADNVTTMGMGRGLSTQTSCSGCRMERNTVSTWPGAADQSRVWNYGGTTRCGNTVAPYVTPLGARKAGVVDALCPSVAP